MAEVRLEAARRAATTKGETHGLRRQGWIPAVVYGKNVEPMAIAIDHKGFVKALERNGSNAIFSILVEGETKPVVTIVKELQREPVYRTIQHVDFHAVSMEDLISAYVPLHLHGTPIGVKEGGIMQENLHQVEVECLPMDIPSYLIVDVSGLGMGDSLFAANLVLPEKVKLLTDAGTALVTLIPPEKEEVAETPAAVAEAPTKSSERTAKEA
ncbi:MAG: 50S ribosomal protein L25 [bacterium]